MTKPVCVKCRCFLRPHKNGIHFTEGMPKVQGAERGLREPAAWEPYKLWRGDLWKCPDCGYELIISAMSNYHEHYLPGFAEEAARSGADKIQINDC